MAAPRKYPDELRERATRLVLDAKAEPGSVGKNVCRRIGEQLGISPETLRGWVKQAEIDAGTRPGTSTDTAARLAELELGESRVTAGECDSEVGVGFLRGRARPPLPVIVD